MSRRRQNRLGVSGVVRTDSREICCCILFLTLRLGNRARQGCPHALVNQARDERGCRQHSAQSARYMLSWICSVNIPYWYFETGGMVSCVSILTAISLGAICWAEVTGARKRIAAVGIALVFAGLLHLPRSSHLFRRRKVERTPARDCGSTRATVLYR